MMFAIIRVPPQLFPTTGADEQYQCSLSDPSLAELRKPGRWLVERMEEIQSAVHRLASMPSLGCKIS